MRKTMVEVPKNRKKRPKYEENSGFGQKKSKNQ